MTDLPGLDQRWLIDVCTTEIRAHRLLFYAVLAPVLGLWLPYMMFGLATSIVLTTGFSLVGSGNEAQAGDSSWIQVASLLVPFCGSAVGFARERRRLRDEDEQARAGQSKVQPKQAALLLDRVDSMWRSIDQARDRAVPQLVFQPNFRVLAHAYDDCAGQVIEVSAGLADRVVRHDVLALSILRHEMAHLVHRDLPAIRRQAAVAGAAIYSARTAMAVCLVATFVVMAVADLGKFPLPVTLGNVIELHGAILIAALIVTLPLLLGQFLLRRYAGFLVALVETRADVTAGLWGDGVQAFSEAIARDPTVKTSTARDYGLAYISPSLSHLPAQERSAIVGDPARMATPKLRYFAVAIGAVWFLTFHQGDEVYDFVLLSLVVALTQAVAVRMAWIAGNRARLSAGRLLILATGLLACQALPLISIEGLAYLAEHLTMAIVTPGGFGSADDANYLGDVRDVVGEFLGFVVAATGGFKFVISILLTGAAFALMFRLGPKPASLNVAGTALVIGVFLVSVAVSYRFFQEPLYQWFRDTAFRLPGLIPDQATGWLTGLSRTAAAFASGASFSMSDMLHGQPLLADQAWLRLSLPHFVTLGTAALLFGRSRRAAAGNEA